MSILAAISVSHLINDMLQALLPSIYPILKVSFHLDFWQIGLITLTSQITASLLQPFVGMYTDRRPQPQSLALGMGATLLGLVSLAMAATFPMLLVSAALVGVGSSIFHPESSRIARVASGGRHGFAQSLFQTGGNFGSSLGALLAAFVVAPRGQRSLAWFTIVAAAGIVLLYYVGRWYERTGTAVPRQARTPVGHPDLSARDVRVALAVLVALVFSKFVYLTSLTSYYTFDLILRFGVSVAKAQR
jgi:FSR family fosmidomycin resistance protein-like MFS transporter